MNYLLLLLFSICLSYTQYMISKFNLPAPWSGYGAIEGVLNKSSDAPMVYRVLVPWLIGRNIKLWKYNLIQVILVYLTLIVLLTQWGISITFIICILLPLTFWYDYWDWSLEIIGFSLALASLPVALLGTIPHGLSRETAPLIGLVYYLHSHDLSGGVLVSLVAILSLLIVRKVQGKHKLYCKRWMIKENWKLIKSGDVKSWFSLGLIALYIMAIPLRQEAIAFIPLCIAGLTMAKINETRVFVSVIPYVAYMLNGFIK